ncbi:MAG: glycoside-pentoside-hexuronide (GPH):cation symporter [Christensenellaceae bacterium]|jgi:sugar (glycoside-pentoside-hexuronide) transporter|nr:glycoside-pentoside-hexuronide (GPH):cation symporter [Christensenellaceae bacterium]
MNDLNTTENAAISTAGAESPELKLKTYTKKEFGTFMTSMFGQNLLITLVSACFLYYTTSTMLLPAAAVGIIMTLARVWDAVNDPIMGVIVDRKQGKRGKCIPFLRIVPIPIAVLTFLCFTNFGIYDYSPDASAAQNAWLLVYMAIIYISWDMIYTVGDIPLWGLTSLMTESDKQKGTVLSFARIIGGIAGGIGTFALQPVALMISAALQPVAGVNAERYGFMIMAAIIAVIGGGLFAICGFTVKEKVIPAPVEKPSLKANFKTMFSNKPFRQIVISGIIGSPRNLIILIVMTIVTYYFASKDGIMALLYMALLGGGMFAGQFIFMALTPKLSTKFGKKALYNWSNIIAGIPLGLIFVMYLIFPHNLTDAFPLILLFIIFTVAGSVSGITQVVQTMMIADCVDYEEFEKGVRPDGAFFSGLTFINKLAGAIATIISTAAYAIVGFEGEKIAEMDEFMKAGNLIREAPQYDKYMMMLFFLISIPPALGSILSVIPTWKYPLTNKAHDDIMIELKARRDAREAVAEDAGEQE